jgi:hypothetical protein
MTYKLEAPATPAAIPAAPVQTVTLTVTSPDTKTETVEVDLSHGDLLADKRLIVALVGLNHVAGAISSNEVVLDVPAADVASVSIAASKVP